jgi:hypothetical protein
MRLLLHVSELESLAMVLSASVADFLVNADVVIRELAHISVIDTEDLRFLCGTERETGNDVHDPEDDSLME